MLTLKGNYLIEEKFIPMYIRNVKCQEGNNKCEMMLDGNYGMIKINSSGDFFYKLNVEECKISYNSFELFRFLVISDNDFWYRVVEILINIKPKVFNNKLLPVPFLVKYSSVFVSDNNNKSDVTWRYDQC